MPPSSSVLAIEKAISKAGINVTLEYIERSSYYQNFKKEVENAIGEQVKGVATEPNIKRLLLFTKVNINPQLIVELQTIYMSLVDYIDMKTFLLKVAEATGQASFDRLGIDGTFALKNEELIRYFDDHTRLISAGIDDTTKEWLAKKIQEGKENLLNPFEIAQSIRDEASAMIRVRAESIVLTETANAMSIVQIEVARRYGITRMRWRTSKDERTCPICLPLEGKEAEVGKGGRFEGGYNHPPSHVRCRCYLEEIIDNKIEGTWQGE